MTELLSATRNILRSRLKLTSRTPWQSSWKENTSRKAALPKCDSGAQLILSAYFGEILYLYLEDNSFLGKTLWFFLWFRLPWSFLKKEWRETFYCFWGLFHKRIAKIEKWRKLQLFHEENRKKWRKTIVFVTFYGPSSATWTHGLLVPNQARYQLRYTRIFNCYTN